MLEVAKPKSKVYQGWCVPPKFGVCLHNRYLDILVRSENAFSVLATHVSRVKFYAEIVLKFGQNYTCVGPFKTDKCYEATENFRLMDNLAMHYQ